MAQPTSSIGVLTFHRCINYGSYWQARCLVEGLMQRGHDAVLLDHRSSRVDMAEWRCALRPVPGNWGEREDRAAYAEKARKFFAAFDALPLSAPFDLDDPAQARPVDIALVGSDEVWNLCHPWYGGKALFYGNDLPAARRASYAASFGNQSWEDGLEKRWIEHLRQFDHVSVRDANSQRIVSAARDSAPPLVLDPVLQFPHVIAPESIDIPAGYVALYGHGMPEWFQQAVRRWADRTGRRIVSIGYRNWWADENWIAAGPAEFAAFMAKADTVVTNFFHGCVFALVYGKPFATAPSDYRSNKVRDLVDALGAEPHLVTEATGPDAYDRLLGQRLDGVIGQRIAQLRHAGESYLDGVLD
ncbi:Polysaccharide pyruvyl transferase [Devosia crocina]|uniref:Polysaccharide pyruvyl transferase n=1 Tax=Devosia crocina TaxID=429728 RepID=A0A1I7NLI1_9HYPH|nr:polysaccharide pyruvyl transferase family protein [Devosia crocina]SFV35496.1 Polysaccharide pyruvyl transferase [Devosia crocina]